MEQINYQENKELFIKFLNKLYNKQNQTDRDLFGEINENNIFSGVLLKSKSIPIGAVLLNKQGENFYSIQILVDEQFRRNGIAEGLFKELIDKTYLPPNTMIYYNYYPENYKSEALSKKLGFDKYLIRSRQSLKKLKILNK